MIRVGIGGWQYAPWRGIFYPSGLKQDGELAFASRQLGSIEINSTFYRMQKPESFRRWRDETPDDFVFSVKAPRYLSYRRTFDDAAAVARFFDSGLAELGPKLGPILWQLPPTMRFEEAVIAELLASLPDRLDSYRLRHVIEVKHQTFVDRRFIELLRAHGVAVAFIDEPGHPAISDVTADFIYARLERTSEAEPAGYPDGALDGWAQRFRTLAAGAEPHDLVRIHSEPAQPRPSRDCFVYFISGAKVRAPAAAQALIARLAR